MAETPITSANQTPLTFSDVGPIAVEQEKLDPRVSDYIHELAVRNGTFSRQVKADRRLFSAVLAEEMPKIPGREADGQALRSLIEGIVEALPTVDTMPVVQADISIAIGRLAPDRLSEPYGRAVIGSFDGAEGVLRQCAIPPMDELPPLDYMAVPTGLVVIAQLVPQQINKYTDMRRLDFGSGENLYSERQTDRPLRYEDPVVPYIANPSLPIPVSHEDERIRKTKEAKDKREAEEDVEEVAAAALLAGRRGSSANQQNAATGQQGLSAEQLGNARYFAKQAREQRSETDEMAAIEYEHPEAATLANDMEEWPGAVELVELETLVGWELTGRESKEELSLEAQAIPETSLSNEITVGQHQSGHAAIVEGEGFFAPAEAEAGAGGAASTPEEGNEAEAEVGEEETEIPGQSEEAKILAAEAAAEETGGTAEPEGETPETEEVAAEEEAMGETETAEAEVGGEGIEAEAGGEPGGAEAEIEPGEAAEAVEEDGNERRWLFSEGVEQQDERKEDNQRAERIERSEEGEKQYNEERREERQEFSFEAEQHGERREGRDEFREEHHEERAEGEQRPERNEETELEEPRQLGREQREDIREKLEQPEREAERRTEQRQEQGAGERREERQELRQEGHAESGGRREDREEFRAEREGPRELGREDRKDFQEKIDRLDEGGHHLHEAGHDPQHEGPSNGLENVAHRHSEEPLHEDAYHQLNETHEAVREEKAHELGRGPREDVRERQEAAHERGDERRRDEDVTGETAYHAIQETHHAVEADEAAHVEKANYSRGEPPPDSDIPEEPERPAVVQHVLDESPSPMGDEVREVAQAVQPQPGKNTRDELLRETAMHVLVEHGIPAALAHHEDVRELAASGGLKASLSVSLGQVGKAAKKAYTMAVKKRQAPPPEPKKAGPQQKITPQPAPQDKAPDTEVRHPHPKMGNDPGE